jgi:superfamily I DNA and/or RNA helicase
MYKCNENVNLWLGVDPSNEYYKIWKSTTTECLKQFMKVIFKFFEIKYMRQPSQVDTKYQIVINA